MPKTKRLMECKKCKMNILTKKIGTRYYCTQCGSYLEADKPIVGKLPSTWWRR